MSKILKIIYFLVFLSSVPLAVGAELKSFPRSPVVPISVDLVVASRQLDFKYYAGTWSDPGTGMLVVSRTGRANQSLTYEETTGPWNGAWPEGFRPQKPDGKQCIHTKRMVWTAEKSLLLQQFSPDVSSDRDAVVINETELQRHKLSQWLPFDLGEARLLWFGWYVSKDVGVRPLSELPWKSDSSSTAGQIISSTLGDQSLASLVSDETAHWLYCGNKNDEPIKLRATDEDIESPIPLLAPINAERRLVIWSSDRSKSAGIPLRCRLETTYLVDGRLRATVEIIRVLQCDLVPPSSERFVFSAPVGTKVFTMGDPSGAPRVWDGNGPATPIRSQEQKNLDDLAARADKLILDHESIPRQAVHSNSRYPGKNGLFLLFSVLLAASLVVVIEVFRRKTRR